MEKIFMFVRLIINQLVGILTGTILALIAQFILPLFLPIFFEKNKNTITIIFLSLGIIYSVFKIWSEEKENSDRLMKAQKEIYNLPKNQEEILQSIYNKGEDLGDILNQYMYVGGTDKSGTVLEGCNNADLVDDLEEDGYIKTSRNNTGIWDLECTIKGKKYIEKRL